MKDNKSRESELPNAKKIALHYMETLVSVVRESVLILDYDLRVIAANPVFYQNFQVSPKETLNVLLYDLGNGQWNIPELRKLLEEILPDKKSIRDYEVTHNFESIGHKTIELNARRIESSQLIILAMEDISARIELEEKLAKYTRGLEAKGFEQTSELAARVKELESINKTMVGRELKMVELKKEITELKKQVPNGKDKNNGSNPTIDN